MRTFIALDIPQDIREQLDRIQSRLQRCDLDAGWVAPDKMHVTLKFLGETHEESLAGVKIAISEVAGRFKRMELSLEGFGFFPNPRRPKVFFITTSSADVLSRMAGMLEDSLTRLSFTKEGRFHSHITLARLKSGRNLDCCMNELQKIQPKGSFVLDHISLYKSTLNPRGSIYEKLAQINLAI